MMAAVVDIYDAMTSDRCYHKGDRPPTKHSNFSIACHLRAIWMLPWCSSSSTSSASIPLDQLWS